MRCPTCEGSGKFPHLYEICRVCEGNGELSDERLKNRDCPVCNGSGKHPNRYTVCRKCDGWGKLSESHDQEPLVFFIKAGTPWTAHQSLERIFSKLCGDVRICDPFYGSSSLSKLALLAHCRSIRFLTAKQGGGEKEFIINRRVREFVSEHPHIELRKAETAALHDRYILTNNEFILLGHGLKDVGKRESFIVRLGRDLAGDIINAVSQAFDEKWARAIPLP